MATNFHRKASTISAENLQPTESKLRQAANLRTDDPQVYFSLGIICWNTNRLVEAEKFFVRSIELQPMNHEAYYYLGLICRKTGRMKKAKILVEHAVELKPDWAAANNTLGIIYKILGRADKAQDCFLKALKCKPDYAGAYNNLGSIQAENKLWAEAESCFCSAARLEPSNYRIYNNWARTLQKLRRYAEAEDCYRQAIELNPGFVAGYNSLGLILKDSGRVEEAVACLHKSLELQTDDLVAYHYLASVLAMSYRFEEAMEYLRRALDIDQDEPETYRILGRVLKMMQRLDEAEAAYRRSIELSPEGQAEKSCFGLGTVYMLRGQYEKAWPYFEMRLGDFKHRHKVHYWQGERLFDKKILLFFEQGFGDTMQFVRYIPWVADQAAQTVVKVQNQLGRLIGNSFNCEVLTDDGENRDNFDYVCSLLSLPYVFKTTEKNIPRNAYLYPEKEAIYKWSRDMQQAGVVDGRLRVGVVWAGNPRHKNDCNRSIPFNCFCRMFAQTKVNWLSLQVGPRAADLTGGDYPILDFTGQFRDFYDTAGIIANLDLIITVDTAVAHLAAALGKKTWIMLPYIVDWRWQLNREDSPWYPSVRLFRQQIPGNWQEVIKRLMTALDEEIKQHIEELEVVE